MGCLQWSRYAIAARDEETGVATNGFFKKKGKTLEKPFFKSLLK